MAVSLGSIFVDLEARTGKFRKGMDRAGKRLNRFQRSTKRMNKSMAVANRRRHDLRLKQVEQALTSMERDEYGQCRKCEDPIGHARLEARPESPYCLDCQAEIDRRHG